MGRVSVTPKAVKASPKSSIKNSNSSKNVLLRGVQRQKGFRGAIREGTPSLHRPFKFKPLRESPYERPDFGLKSKLQTITEESDDDEQEHPATIKSLRFELEQGDGDDTLVDKTLRDSNSLELYDKGKEVDMSSDGSDFGDWEDETKLVEKFRGRDAIDFEQTSLADLANRLEGPMQANSEYLKQYLAHTLAPAARQVKEVHKALDEKVDVGFGIGILSFDDACKKMEQLSLVDEEDIKRAYMQSQRKVREYLRQIKGAYEERERLWDELHASVEKAADKALSTIASAKTEIDDIAAAIDKKSKELTKASAKDNKAKLLRDLLADMQD